jgi:hypothetical protein
MSIRSGGLDLVGFCLVALVWGQLSTQFFFQSWMGFLYSLCCFIGIAKRTRPYPYLFSLLFAYFTETVFYGILLFIGFYVLYYRLALGRSEVEVLVYLISATVRMVVVVPKISPTLDAVWEKVNGPPPDKDTPAD